MARGAPRIIRTGNDAVDRSMSAIAEAVRQLDAEMDEPAIAITNVTVKTTATAIPHLLGRKLVGWQMSRIRGQAMVSDQQDSNATPDRTLVLIASAEVVVDLLVW